MKRSNPSQNLFQSFFLSTPRWYFFALAAIFLLYIAAWAGSAQVLAGAYHNAGQLSAPDQLIIAAGGDSGEYVALATSLLHGHFALPGESFEYFRTPGYPAFIAIIEFLGGSYLAVTFLQILLAFTLALVILALGRKFLDVRVGILASLIFLLNPLVLLMSLEVMSDMVFTFLLLLGMAAILFFIARFPLRTVIFSALVFAIATYVRPAGVVALPLFIAPIIATPLPWMRKFWCSLLLAAIFIIALVPWMLRNQHDSGVFSFSSLAAYNLTAYNVPLFEATMHSDSSLDELLSAQSTIGIPVTQWRNLSSSAALEHYDRTMLLQSPFRYIAYHLFESTGFFINSGLSPLLSYMSVPLHFTMPAATTVSLKDLLVQRKFGLFITTVVSPWWLFVERIFLAIGVVLMLLGLFDKRRVPFVWLAAFIIFYFAALSGPVAEARYRLPADPFLELLIASGLVAVWSFFHKAFKRSASLIPGVQIPVE